VGNAFDYPILLENPMISLIKPVAKLCVLDSVLTKPAFLTNTLPK